MNIVFIHLLHVSENASRLSARCLSPDCPWGRAILPTQRDRDLHPHRVILEVRSPPLPLPRRAFHAAFDVAVADVIGHSLA